MARYVGLAKEEQSPEGENAEGVSKQPRLKASSDAALETSLLTSTMTKVGEARGAGVGNQASDGPKSSELSLSLFSSSSSSSSSGSLSKESPWKF